MPKHENDEDDPLELNAVSLPAESLEPMVEALVEEYLWMGRDVEGVLALFRNPEYQGPHAVYHAKGEAWVRARIDEVAQGVPRITTTTVDAEPEAKPESFEV